MVKKVQSTEVAGGGPQWDPSGIRKRVKEQLRKISREERKRVSEQVCTLFVNELISHGVLSEGKSLRVALFSPLADELDLRWVHSRFFAQNAQIYYPRIQGLHLEWVRWPSSQEESTPGERSKDRAASIRDEGGELPFWQQGQLGVLEPSMALPAERDPQFDLILVPGLAFDGQGERIGRGKGFYDRFLAKASQGLRVSLAYDFQIFPRLPTQAWDQRVHWVLSERSEVRTEFLENWLKQWSKK